MTEFIAAISIVFVVLLGDGSSGASLRCANLACSEPSIYWDVPHDYPPGVPPPIIEAGDCRAWGSCEVPR